jgi:hypothetical protein
MTSAPNGDGVGASEPLSFIRFSVLALLGLSSCTSSGFWGKSDSAIADFAALDASYSVDAELDLELRQLILLRDALPPSGFSSSEAESRAHAAYKAQLTSLAMRAGDWIAPQRLLDDLAHGELHGPQVWAKRKASYRETGSARDAYLLGRFEIGARAQQLFDKAHRLAPELSWARHSYAWQRRAGEGARGAELEIKAVDRAASLYETVYFEIASARHSLSQLGGSRLAAEARLEELSAHPRLLPEESAALRAWAVGSSLQPNAVSTDGLGTSGRIYAGDNYTRALGLLEAGSGLADSDLPQLCRAIDGASSAGRNRNERLRSMLVRLNGRDGPIASGLRDVFQLELNGSRFPELLGVNYSKEQVRAASSLAVGDLSPWFLQWWSGLPRFLVDAFMEDVSTRKDSSLHLNEGLLQLSERFQESSRVYGLGEDDPNSRTGTDPLADLVSAGWFDVVRVLFAGDDPKASKELRSRSLTAEEFLSELEYFAAMATGENAEIGLDDALNAIDELARAAELLAEDSSPLLDSPRIRYGPFAEVVHPGPLYLGAGARPEGVGDGDEVDGLAKVLASIGRMGIVGQQLGDFDAVVRPLLAWEWVAGEHLGAPFEGTVFWCEGVDVPSRYERGGAGITGAALHEGYWIDIEAVRATWDDWRQLRERFRFAVESPLVHSAPESLPRDRTQSVPLLGESKRLAIQMFKDRERNPVDFDEFLRATAVHEEGHLCDRARYFPLVDHKAEALKFLVEVGFSPVGLMRRIEYRAQLVALCEVDDPRLVLFDILGQVEGLEARVVGTGMTPHAVAYQSLLRDLLDVMDQQLAGESAERLGLKPDRYLRWQLHGIGAESLRLVALELAKREGLVE